jgi:hypothetical protein
MLRPGHFHRWSFFMGGTAQQRPSLPKSEHQLVQSGQGRIGVGTKDKLRPSLRTGQANFSHPALQLVVSLQRRSADASRAHIRFEQWMAPVTRAANRLRSSVEGLHTCVALHRFESRGHSRCVFPSIFCSLSPPSCLPWLHGHYPASALLRRLCHLPGAVLRALRAAMNAAPCPDRDP